MFITNQLLTVNNKKKMANNVFMMLSLVLNLAKCEIQHYLIEQPNVRGNKVENEVHWTLDLNGSYIIESVRINEIFKENKLFWINVKTNNTSKVCKQMFEDVNGWVVIKCKESMVIGRLLTIVTNFRNFGQINYILSIDICSRTKYPLIESYVSVDSSLDDDNKTLVYRENISCKLIASWTNYSWWILIDMKEDVFVESFTFSGNFSEQVKYENKYVRAQVTNRRNVEIIETETQCNGSSHSTFTCNKKGTSILVKGSPNKEIGYLHCKPFIFGYKGREKLQKILGKCNFKILEKIDKKDTIEKKDVSNHFWIVTLAALSSLLILLCLVTFGLLRRIKRSRTKRCDCYLMQDLQTNKLHNHSKKDSLNLESKDEFRDGLCCLLPIENAKPSNIGKNIHNLHKNRFQNIIPFDENIVTLEGDDNNYINASFIRGFDSNPMAYIATQGPKDNTMNEFWKLVWQYDVGVIVMLMQLTENFSQKCEQYWPDIDQHEAVFGKISVTAVHERQLLDFCLRHLIVKLIDSNEPDRMVIHTQFLSWSDDNAPEYSFPLLDFRNKVNYFQDKSKGPLLVHCSAGVGRTGTYIAIDYLIKQAKADGKESVFECVKDLRLQRMDMVQNKIQYHFIFKSVKEAKEVPQTGMTLNDFDKKFNGIIKHSSIQTSQKLCQTIIEEHVHLYKTLKKINRKTSEKFFCDAGVLKNERSCGNIDANNEACVKEALNISIQCYKMSNKHILSQIPIPEMRSNFWNMIWDNDVQHVLLLEDGKEPYWPENNLIALKLNDLEISQTLEDKSNIFCTKRKFLLLKEDQQSQAEPPLKEIIQYHVTKLLWPDYSQVPKNKKKFQIILQQLVKSDKRIVIQCLNGSRRCGLTAAAMLMIDMILLDGAVDPFLACRYVLASRPDAITCQEQFNFLYELALDILEDSEILLSNIDSSD